MSRAPALLQQPRESSEHKRAMNQFGQRTVASLLRAYPGSSSKQGEEVSLADFLDRNSADAGHPLDKPQLPISTSISPDRSRVSERLTTHRLSKLKRKRSILLDQGDRGTRVVVERPQHQGNPCGRPHLLVMGGVPTPRSKPQRSGLYQSHHSYNHYADGRGWWGEGMVGMEEAGTACAWEGVASMSLGTSAAAASP